MVFPEFSEEDAKKINKKNFNEIREKSDFPELFDLVWAIMKPIPDDRIELNGIFETIENI